MQRSDQAIFVAQQRGKIDVDAVLFRALDGDGRGLGLRYETDQVERVAADVVQRAAAEFRLFLDRVLPVEEEAEGRVDAADRAENAAGEDVPAGFSRPNTIENFSPS